MASQYNSYLRLSFLNAVDSFLSPGVFIVINAMIVIAKLQSAEIRLCPFLNHQIPRMLCFSTPAIYGAVPYRFLLMSNRSQEIILIQFQIARLRFEHWVLTWFYVQQCKYVVGIGPHIVRTNEILSKEWKGSTPQQLYQIFSPKSNIPKVFWLFLFI